MDECHREQVRIVEVRGYAQEGEVVDGWLRGQTRSAWYGLATSVLEIRVLPGETGSDAARRFNDALDSLCAQPRWDESGVYSLDCAVRRFLRLGQQ